MALKLDKYLISIYLLQTVYKDLLKKFKKNQEKLPKTPKIKKKQTVIVFSVVFLDFFKNRTFKNTMVFCVTLRAPTSLAGTIICPATVIFAFHLLMGGPLFKALIHTEELIQMGSVTLNI